MTLLTETDYSVYSDAELETLIKEETDRLNALSVDLYSAIDRQQQVRAMFGEERLISAPQRFMARSTRIVEVEARVKQLEERRRFYEDRVRQREARILAATSRIEELERGIIRLQIFRASPRTIAGTRRIISGLRGWQTRLRYYQREDNYSIYILRTVFLPSERSSLTRLRNLQVKEEAQVKRLDALKQEQDQLLSQIEYLQTEAQLERLRLARKREEQNRRRRLRRVTLNFYIIIEGKTKTYPHPSRGKVKRKYPKGRFQCFFECDVWVSPRTMDIDQSREPFQINVGLVSRESIAEFLEEFNVNYNIKDLTLGEVSRIASQDDLGRPPKKLSVERTVEGPEHDDNPQKDWKRAVNRYVVSDEEYRRILKTREQLDPNIQAYIQLLKEMRRWVD